VGQPGQARFPEAIFQQERNKTRAGIVLISDDPNRVVSAILAQVKR
jgi:hypothetical protein